MKNIGYLSADGYGIMIFAPDVLTQYLTAKKCRAKKLLSYFDKNKTFFYQTIKDGKLLPLYKLSAFQYDLFITIDKKEIQIPEGYIKVYENKGFYTEVGPENKLCFASFDFVEYEIDLIKQHITDESNMIESGPEGILEKYHTAIGLKIDQGVYTLDVVGLKRENPLKRESKNYAYVFRFTKNEYAVNDNFIKADNDMFTFDIKEYENNPS